MLSARTAEWIAQSHGDMARSSSREVQSRNCLIASGMLADAWLEGEAALSTAMASLEAYFGIDTPRMIAKVMALQEQLPSVAALYNIALPQRLDANQLMFEAKLLLAERNHRLQQDLLRQQQEIETLRRQREVLDHQAKLDPLTSLFNRRYIEEHLERVFQQACDNKTCLSLVFIDLDRFKDINDEFGHVTGDKVLKGFAAILDSLFREGEALAGRYGGEEFIVILPETGGDLAHQRVKEIRHELQGKALAYACGVPILVTASYGIAAMEEAERFTSASELVATADQCMYRSKRSGCNRVTAVTSPSREVQS